VHSDIGLDKPFFSNLLVDGIWEVDAHFGLTGEHTLHLVTATNLGVSLIAYYRRILSRNNERAKELRTKLRHGEPVPGEGRWPGIPMSALPKGLRSEVSVTVRIAEDKT
jgi:hypothetical protein